MLAWSVAVCRLLALEQPQLEVHSPGRGETDAKGSLYLGGLVPCDCEVEKDPAIFRGKNIVYVKNNRGVIFFILFSFLDLIWRVLLPPRISEFSFMASVCNAGVELYFLQLWRSLGRQTRENAVYTKKQISLRVRNFYLLIYSFVQKMCIECLQSTRLSLGAEDTAVSLLSWNIILVKGDRSL